MERISRRDVLRMGAIATGGILAGCAPTVIKETVVVEKEVEKVVKETVVVEQQVEKQVTVVVDKAAEKAATMKGKIIWDTFRAQPGEGQWGQERLDTFKQTWPDVTVELRPIPQTAQQDAYGKMYAMEAAGDLGDVCAFDPSHFHFWRAIDKNIIVPVDDLMAADGTNLDEWFPQFIEMQRYKGKIYGLPSWGWSGQDALVVNELVIQELGGELPDPTLYATTWDQILEWIEKGHKAAGDNVERYGFQWMGGEAGYTVMARWFGGDLINPEGTKTVFQDDDKALQGLKMVYDLVVNKKLTPAPGALGQGVSTEAAAAEGRLTMYHAGSLSAYNAQRAIQDKTKAQIGVVLFPKRPDGKIPSQIRGGTWNVHRASKLPAIAWEFIRHITSKDGIIGFNLFGGNTSLTRPDVLPVLRAQTPVYKHFENNLMNGMVIHAPANSRGREFTDAVGQIGAKVMDQVQPIPFEQGIAELAAAVQKVLDTPPA